MTPRKPGSQRRQWKCALEVSPWPRFIYFLYLPWFFCFLYVLYYLYNPASATIEVHWGRHGFDGSCRDPKACRAPPARNRVEK